MNTLTHRTLAMLPPDTQAKIRAHQYIDDIDEIVQNAALALLEARRDDTVRDVFKRARSGARRRTQDPAYYGRSLDGIADTLAADADAAGAPRARKRKEITREVAADFRVTPRRARQIVAQQLQRAQQGDLFADDGSDKGEE